MIACDAANVANMMVTSDNRITQWLELAGNLQQALTQPDHAARIIIMGLKHGAGDSPAGPADLLLQYTPARWPRGHRLCSCHIMWH